METLQLILYPLILFLDHLFSILYRLIGSAGISIIALAILVSSMIQPLRRSHVDHQYKNMFKIDKMFQVNGTIFKRENWQQIR
jgi:predicted membrane protein